MEEGTKSKKTVFVGGISDDTDETTLYENFSTFGASSIKLIYLASDMCSPQLILPFYEIGDILEVQLPPPATQYHQNQAATGEL
jgi:peptidyl-prolyl isomerase E (cyclophilin E)